MECSYASERRIIMSYISKIENGTVEPGVNLFLRIINALGLKFDIVKPIVQM